MTTEITADLNGPIFSNDRDRLILQALSTTLMRVGDRVQRRRKGLGARRNTITTRLHETAFEALMEISTTLADPHDPTQRPRQPNFNPRVTGKSWLAANRGVADTSRGVIGAMMPNVLRSELRKVLGQL